MCILWSFDCTDLWDLLSTTTLCSSYFPSHELRQNGGIDCIFIHMERRGGSLLALKRLDWACDSWKLSTKTWASVNFCFKRLTDWACVFFVWNDQAGALLKQCVLHWVCDLCGWSQNAGHRFVVPSYAIFGVSFLFGADGAEVVINKKMYAIGVRSLVVGRNYWGIVFVTNSLMLPTRNFICSSGWVESCGLHTDPRGVDVAMWENWLTVNPPSAQASAVTPLGISCGYFLEQHAFWALFWVFFSARGGGGNWTIEESASWWRHDHTCFSSLYVWVITFETWPGYMEVDSNRFFRRGQLDRKFLLGGAGELVPNDAKRHRFCVWIILMITVVRGCSSFRSDFCGCPEDILNLFCGRPAHIDLDTQGLYNLILLA